MSFCREVRDVRQSCRNVVLVEYASNLVVESVRNERYFQCEECQDGSFLFSVCDCVCVRLAKCLVIRCV